MRSYRRDKNKNGKYVDKEQDKSARNRRHKQTKIRRQIGKQQKTRKSDNDSRPQWDQKGDSPAGQSKAVCPDERDQNGNYKGSNIKCHIIFAEDSGIGIKQHRDQEGAGQNAGRQCRSEAGIVLFQPAVQEKAIEKHGKKDKLHMLPGRFTDREEKADDEVLQRPVIHKMSKTSGDQNKNYSNESKTF